MANIPTCESIVGIFFFILEYIIKLKNCENALQMTNFMV